MAKITEVCISNQEKWDSIVQSFHDYDVFYLSGYVKAFMKETLESGTPIMILYENGGDRAINVVFKRDIAFDRFLVGKIEQGKYFDLISPYGYGGFWGKVDDWDKLNSTYLKYCTQSRYVCEFVRFELFSEYYKHYTGKVETRTHNVVRSLEIPIDEIWMDFKQKVRKNVKKANLNGLTCFFENTDDHLEDFLNIYYGTMVRNSADAGFFFTKQFFIDLLKMRDNIMFFYVTYETMIISAELVLFASENCYSYLGGTNKDFFELRPNDFLKYEIIKWAKEKGLKRFVLGGGYGSDDGIFQYKLCFAPRGEYDFFIGQKVFDMKTYNKLVGLRPKDELNERYFPLYRSNNA